MISDHVVSNDRVWRPAYETTSESSSDIDIETNDGKYISLVEPGIFPIGPSYNLPRNGFGESSTDQTLPRRKNSRGSKVGDVGTHVNQGTASVLLDHTFGTNPSTNPDNMIDSTDNITASMNLPEPTPVDFDKTVPVGLGKQRHDSSNSHRSNEDDTNNFTFFDSKTNETGHDNNVFEHEISTNWSSFPPQIEPKEQQRGEVSVAVVQPYNASKPNKTNATTARMSAQVQGNTPHYNVAIRSKNNSNVSARLSSSTHPRNENLQTRSNASSKDTPSKSKSNNTRF